ncbi:MAG: hypothetical protein ABEN55_21815, partial [Bradymonadaceae bacterium]
SASGMPYKVTPVHSSPARESAISKRFTAIWLACSMSLAAASGCDRFSSDAETREKSSTVRAEQSVDTPDDGQTRSGRSNHDHYFVEVVPEPNPIPFQQLFQMSVRVWTSADRETPAKGVSVDQVRARMPAHDHGMKTAPEVVEKGPGHFTVEGMRFHMRGDGEDGRWVLELVMNGDQGIDNVTFEYQCCVSQ